MGSLGKESHGHDMTNSHLLVHAFEYYRPVTLKEALTFLRENAGRAEVLAGGTYLLVQMKMERTAPECLVDVAGLADLAGIRVADDHLKIGALTPIWEIRNSAIVKSRHTALADACAAFGSTQIQLTGTIGGNVCNGSPASDAVPALVALDAEVVLGRAEGERSSPMEGFLIRPGETAIKGGELLTAIRVPRPEARSGSAFVKISRVRADLAKASAAAQIVRDGETIVDCRLALGSVGPTVVRACTAEQMLCGTRFSTESALAAGRAAAGDVAPIGDVRSTAWYRREVVQALVHDALQLAWERAGEDAGSEVVGGRSVSSEVGGARGASRHATRRLGPTDTVRIELTVDGEEHWLEVAPNELLINVLRERLDLTGTKYGCGIGECGACTVHLDGVPTLSCLTLAVAADGRNVTTVEGLARPGGELHAVQEAFIDHAAFQCGYCTPGILMMTKRLLEDNPAPEEEDIRDYLKGNRCRCTGFASIVRAVRSCSE